MPAEEELLCVSIKLYPVTAKQSDRNNLIRDHPLQNGFLVVIE